MLDTPALLAHTNDLELIIRHVLAGLGHGIHAGRERGAGVEFSEYRAYAPGDEKLDKEYNRFIYHAIGKGHSITSILQYMSGEKVIK
eukprot:gene31505-35570_t